MIRAFSGIAFALPADHSQARGSTVHHFADSISESESAAIGTPYSDQPASLIILPSDGDAARANR